MFNSNNLLKSSDESSDRGKYIYIIIFYIF